MRLPPSFQPLRRQGPAGGDGDDDSGSDGNSNNDNGPTTNPASGGYSSSNSTNSTTTTTSSNSNSNPPSGNNNNKAVVIGVTVTFAVLIALSFISYIVLRRLRRSHANPKYVPTQFLKRKWRLWSPSSKYGPVPGGQPSSSQPQSSRNLNTAYNPAATQEDDDAAGVDRHTSVRSVMTLPAYSQDPKATEQVIGREGERAGMDVVVEFPETVDEEEARREEQMESLYQIRLARRQEFAEREARRQERRDARARGDWDTLDRLRRESRARAESAASLTTSAVAGSGAMIVEHQSRERERRISAVSYADVGHVRHDGTRLRANSSESDNRPLLDSAASMGEGRTSRVSISSSLVMPPPSILHHQRHHSTGSMLSVATTMSDMSHSGGQPTPQSSAGQQDESTPSDIGDLHIPPPVEPPEYDNHEWEETPAYSSPVAARGEVGGDGDGANRLPSVSLTRLPSIRPLPAIEIETVSPVNAQPTGPNPLQ